jgi:purine nucleosidase
MPLSFILDTDIGTNVDDALALAFAVRHPDLDLRAVTTVSGDTMRRARIAKKLLLLASREDIEVAAGVPCEARGGRSVEHGHEGAGLLDENETLPISERDAVTLLVEECFARDFEIATVGMQSNVAAALKRDQRFSQHVPRLTVMGGVFGPVRFLGQVLPPSIDHNLNVDPGASLLALNAGFEALYVPLNVTMGAWLLSKHVDALRRGDALCRALAQQIDAWSPILRSMRGAIPSDHAALLHDPLAVACMIDRRFVTAERLPVTVVLRDGHVQTLVDPNSERSAEVITSVDGPAFAQFWLETVLRS